MNNKNAFKEELKRKGWFSVLAEALTVFVLGPVCIYALVILLEYAR